MNWYTFQYVLYTFCTTNQYLAQSIDVEEGGGGGGIKKK